MSKQNNKSRSLSLFLHIFNFLFHIYHLAFHHWPFLIRLFSQALLFKVYFVVTKIKKQFVFFFLWRFLNALFCGPLYAFVKFNVSRRIVVSIEKGLSFEQMSHSWIKKGASSGSQHGISLRQKHLLTQKAYFLITLNGSLHCCHYYYYHTTHRLMQSLNIAIWAAEWKKGVQNSLLLYLVSLQEAKQY